MDREGCLEYSRQLAEAVAVEAEKSRCNCILASGGIDTSFVALSLLQASLKPISITVSFPGSPDLYYSRLLARSLGLRHVVVSARRDNIRGCLQTTLSTLKTIDPIEVVCDIPVCLGLVEAKRLGCNCVMTGDGGDELFLGYSFLLNLPREKLEEWLNRMLSKEGFPAEEIGEALNVRVVPGLFTRPIKKLAREIPLECMIGEYRGARWGKLLLRLFLMEHGLGEIAWRVKTPINIGSGSNTLLDEWAGGISGIEAVELSRESGILLPSRPHAFLYKKLMEYRVDPPPPCSDPDRICPVCGRCLRNGHCRFCGASLSYGNRVSVYSDDLLDIVLESTGSLGVG